ncbi:MAG: TIGR03915 family putative DNA repair protein [Clostridia bacterium]|nr:TIGR03915 family putative DNA repair protein [Clostridia bacterium]
MRNLYYVDGSPECFFTAVFEAWKDGNAYLFSQPNIQTGLGDSWHDVTPDPAKAARVVKKLAALDSRAPYEIDCILRSFSDEKEQIAFEYIRLLVQGGVPVRERLSEPVARRAIELQQKVGAETHNLKGFLRFQETQGGVFYAPCAPDHDIVDLLMPHFVSRFKTVAFVIHDTKRHVAGIYDGRTWRLCATPKNAELILTEQEDGFSRLWKQYYNQVAIPERKNTRQMKAYMPVRYWKFMTEKQGE